jgi:Co/Zn/Cd efflux system component
MPLMSGQPQSPDTLSSISLLFSAFVGLILYGFVFWLLHRHRAAFKTPPHDESMLEA